MNPDVARENRELHTLRRRVLVLSHLANEYGEFLRDLKAELDVSHDAEPQEIVDAVRRLAWGAS